MDWKHSDVSRVEIKDIKQLQWKEKLRCASDNPLKKKKKSMAW